MRERLDFTLAIAEWFLDEAERLLSSGDAARAVSSLYLAAHMLRRQNRDLTMPRAEAIVQRLAQAISLDSALEQAKSPATRGGGRWLHVFNQALPNGGHTAMALRWIANDTSQRSHSVAVLSQRAAVPQVLADAVALSGGAVYSADPDASFLARARWLRRLSRQGFAGIVLHVAEDDVMSALAFGVSGGPPVMLVNHAAHVYWLGASIVDLVVNCRGSELESLWTRHYRDIARSATVPIPLPIALAQVEAPARSAELQRQAKRELGLPDDAIVILTVGDNFKYRPMPDLDFFETALSTLKDLPDAYILAVGPAEDEHWRRAAAMSGSRIRAYGKQNPVRPEFHQAADIYIEGFPFGSTTALLESGIRGIPVVLAPAQCPPPYGSDGVSLDAVVERSPSLDAYKQQILQLAKNPDLRRERGAAVAAAIRQHHTGEGWFHYLESAVGSLPLTHSIYPPGNPKRTPETIHDYWARFRAQQEAGAEDLLDAAIGLALSQGIRPKITPSLLAACKGIRTQRVMRGVPLPLVRVLCDWVMPLISVGRAERLYGDVAHACRPGGKAFRVFSALMPKGMW